MTRQELTQKCGAVMIAHLQGKGFPAMTVEQILAERKPMWIALEGAGLLQPGMDFLKFCKIAEQKALESMSTDEMLDELLRGILK